MQEVVRDMPDVPGQVVNRTALVLQQANLMKYHGTELTIIDRVELVLPLGEPNG